MANILLAQMKVYSLSSNRTEAVFSIGTLPAQEKTEPQENQIDTCNPIRFLTRKNPLSTIEVYRY